MMTPQHCQGFRQFKHLKSFACYCSECSEALETFSDEFDRPHKCSEFGKEVDFTECALSGSA
jgi:hypothetical protein